MRLSEGSPSQRTTFYMILFLWSVRSRKINRDWKESSGCLGLGKEIGRRWLMGVGFPFGVIKYSKIDHVMTIQLCEYIKDHWIISFSRVNCMVWEWYLNKDVKKKKKDHEGLSLLRGKAWSGWGSHPGVKCRALPGSSSTRSVSGKVGWLTTPAFPQGSASECSSLTRGPLCEVVTLVLAIYSVWAIL